MTSKTNNGTVFDDAMERQLGALHQYIDVQAVQDEGDHEAMQGALLVALCNKVVE